MWSNNWKVHEVHADFVVDINQWLENRDDAQAENYGSKIFKNGRQILIFCDKTAFYGSKFYDLLRKNEKHFLSSQIEKNLPSSFDFL